MFTAQEFRESFPYFTQELFPDERVDFQLRFAEKLLNQARWDDMWRHGCFLLTAHNLTLEQEAKKASDGTGGTSASVGAITSSSKTVGSISISETRGGASVSDPLSGQYGLTIYGKQYWELAQLIGVGGIQL